MYFFYTLTIVAIVSAGLALYILNRNQKVFIFGVHLIHKIYRFDNPDYEVQKEAFQKLSYDKMLYSLKPLRSFMKGTILEDL